MKEDTEAGSSMCDLVMSKLKEIGVRTKLKKIKCFLQKQVEKELATTTRMFGAPLCEQPMENNDSGSIIPRFLRQSTNFLSDHLTSENIFRKNGLLRRQKELKKILNQGGTLDGASVDDVASLFKQWFRELPEPIIPFAYHDLFFKCYEICKSRSNQTAVLLACLLLPGHHLTALKHALNFLASVALHSKTNRMDSWNLGVVMAPNFLPPEKDTIDKMDKASNKLVLPQTELVQMLIDHAQEVGTLPACQLEISCPLEDDSQENVLDPNLRRKKRRSMHEVVDCLRKRVVHASPEDGGKKPPRSASKRKADNSSLPQPSPCKKRIVGQMSLPPSIPVSGNLTPITPLSNQLHDMNIYGSFASPTPKKAFGLLRRRSRYRKSKSTRKRNSKDGAASKCTPDPFSNNNSSDFEKQPSPKQQKLLISDANETQVDSCLEVETVVPDLQTRTEEKDSDTKHAAEEKCYAGLEVSLNSTDSEMSMPVQFVDVDRSERKKCLKRGRPNTLKMGLKSPFVPRSCSEPANISKMGSSFSPILEKKFQEGKAEALILESLTQSVDSEPTGKTLRRSLSESDSSLRRFLKEKILDVLSFTSEEFSLGSTSDGKTNDVSATPYSIDERSQRLSVDNLDDPFLTPDLSAIEAPGRNLSIEEQSSNEWSHYNSNCHNPFSVNTMTSEIGTLQSVNSIDAVETQERPAKDEDFNVSSPVLNFDANQELEKETPSTPLFDTKMKDVIQLNKNNSCGRNIKCSTPLPVKNAWMNENEFKALLDNVPPESEGTKRESILQLRVTNAGRVRANVEHYDKITIPQRDSPYPKVRDGAFGRNGLVMRSARDFRPCNIDSQGFVVPKGIPTSIKRCNRPLRSNTMAQDSPTARRGSNIRLARNAERKFVSHKNEQNLKPLRSKLCFNENCKENNISDNDQ